MMTQTDFENVGGAVAGIPIGQRLVVYRRLVSFLGARYPKFDPDKFGASMNIPPLLRVTTQQNEEVSNASTQGNSQEDRRKEGGGEEDNDSSREVGVG